MTLEFICAERILSFCELEILEKATVCRRKRNRLNFYRANSCISEDFLRIPSNAKKIRFWEYSEYSGGRSYGNPTFYDLFGIPISSVSNKFISGKTF
jgi:hypothetical protein